MSVNQTYGETFSKLCKAKEIKISEVSKKSGIPKSTLSRFTKGATTFTLDQIDAALEAIHVDLSEYDFYLNHFQHNYYERYFSKIDKAALNDDDKALQEIYDEASQYGEQMIALSTKARLHGLEEDEAITVCSYIINIETFSFYELLILSDTISEFSPAMIAGVIQDLDRHHKEFERRSRYRRVICQIACQAAAVCIRQGQSAQKEAYEALLLAEKYCHEKDIYSRQLYRFMKGYYNVFHGQGSEHKQGLEDMKKVIEIFEWLGSEKLARIYRKFYEDNITKVEFPLWLSDWLK